MRAKLSCFWPVFSPDLRGVNSERISDVRFGFARPKQILGMYRELCGGKTVPYEQLCNLFDQETKHGQNMALYSKLLQQAIDSIAVTFRKRVASALQTGRSLVIPN